MNTIYTTRITRITRFLSLPLGRFGGALFYLLSLLTLASSCQMLDERDLCCYNVQLIYRYHRLGKDELSTRVQTMKHFLFNSDGVLQEVYNVSGTAVKRLELVIPSGDYTIISFANVEDPSFFKAFVVGQSKMSELELYIDNLNPEGYQDNSERLYFAYRNFRVAKSGVKYYMVDCTHAHNILTVNVRWKNQSPPPNNKYTMELTNVPGNYQFPIQHWVALGEVESDATLPESTTATVVHAIPQHLEQDVHHQVQARFKANGNLVGSFITYRYTDERIPSYCLYGDNGALMKVIDLAKFFRQVGWKLTLNLEQVFDITITIDGDKVYVSATNIADWEDGGTIHN